MHAGRQGQHSMRTKGCKKMGGGWRGGGKEQVGYRLHVDTEGSVCECILLQGVGMKLQDLGMQTQKIPLLPFS